MLIMQTINDALIELGVINPNEEATPQDHEFGLRTLNRIIDSYNTQNLLITYLQDIEYEAPYTVNECETADPDDLTTRAWGNTLTIGHCMQINTAAPIDIQSLVWRQNSFTQSAGLPSTTANNSTDYKSKPFTLDQWSAIGYKNTIGIPFMHYIQKMDNNNIKIYFDRIPQFGLVLRLAAKFPYTGKNSKGNEYVPTDDINWSFGFEKMLCMRLAVELAPSYEVSPSTVTIAKAEEAENNVKAHNYLPRTLDGDLALLGAGRQRGMRQNRARF